LKNSLKMCPHGPQMRLLQDVFCVSGGGHAKQFLI